MMKNTTTILKSEAIEKMSKASEKKDCSENSQCSGVPRLEKHRRVDKGQLNKIGRNDHTRFPHIACVYSYFLGSFLVANQSVSSIAAPSIAFSIIPHKGCKTDRKGFISTADCFLSLFCAHLTFNAWGRQSVIWAIFVTHAAGENEPALEDSSRRATQRVQYAEGECIHRIHVDMRPNWSGL